MFYYKSCKDDSQVIDKLNDLAEKHPTRGFDHYFGRIRNDGLIWNHKRVKRVYTLLGLNKRRKRKRRLPARVKEPLIQPEDINKTWSMDFMSDALVSGRKVRLLNVLDDFNREVLAIEADTSIPGEGVCRILDQVIDWRGKPEEIRVDNGPEFISWAFANYCEQKGIRIKYIQPGKPVQNAYIERFNRTLREDILDAYLFEDLQQLRILLEKWMEDYNNNYPHQSLSGKSPRSFAVNSGKLCEFTTIHSNDGGNKSRNC
jgi:putative transposase